MITRFLSTYTLESLLMPLIVVCVLGGLLVVVSRWRGGNRSLRVALYLVLLYGIAEFGVCRNVYCFAAVARVLKLDNVGFRQLDIMHMELSRRENAVGAKYLAVGTSQTGAVYGPYSRSHKDLKIFAQAGLGLAELALYRDFIVKRCTGTVLLYVSEFDLGPRPPIDAMKLAPPQSPHELWKLSTALHRTGAASTWEIADLWMANAISLYRYQFIFKGFVKRISGENDAFPQGKLSAESRLGEFREAQELGIKALDDEWFQTNASALDEFLAWSDRKGLRVVVVEGQYHPEVRSMMKELPSMARALTQAVCAKHENARFLSVETTGEFAADDYLDITHVSPEAGTRFVERLIAYLDELGAAESAAPGATDASLPRSPR